MKRLLVIDSSVTRSSPSMRCWLAASDVFSGEFDEIEVWANRCDLNGKNIRFNPIRGFSRFGPLSQAYFDRVAKARFRALSDDFVRETLIQCTGSTVPRADVRFMHFWNIAFMETARGKPQDLEMTWRESFFRRLAVRGERAAQRPGATGAWWCVSRGIAEKITRDDASGAAVSILPNAYDDTRFNAGGRAKWRGVMRDNHGFTEDETVFCFSGFGHFERKGLRQAAEAVHSLASRGLEARLMVIGGKPEVIESFKRKLASRGVDTARIVFTGMVTEMEKHLSAADALLFPSHFEAFSLAEIEAGALGLRLYLTDHPGNEMILREGVNGRLLPWDVEGMADVLAEEIRSGAVLAPHHEIGEALTPAGYRVRLGELFAEAMERKWPGGS